MPKDSDTRLQVVTSALENFRLERDSGEVRIRINEGTIVSIEKNTKIL